MSDFFNTPENNVSPEEDTFSEYEISTTDGPGKSKDVRKNRVAPWSFIQRYFGTDPNKNVTDPTQQTHDGINSQKIRLRFVRDFIESVAKIPSYFPKNFFDQFKLQFFEDKDRLYIYDYINRRWCWVSLSTDEYETTQLGVPNEALLSTDWIGANPGLSSNAATVANGVYVSSSDSTGYSWINFLIGFVGYLDFDNQKRVRLEMTGLPESIAGGEQDGFGFIDPNTSPPILLNPADGFDINTIERCIAFMRVGSTLYAVCGDGTNNHHEVVPGVTLNANVTLRYKILWKPDTGEVVFFINDEEKNRITAAVPTTPGVNGLFMFYAGSNQGYSFVFPKLGLQIN